MTDRDEKVRKRLKQIAAEYISKEAGRNSLITVTTTDISPDFRHATIYVTVLPTEQEEEALHFLKRHGSDFRSYAAGQLQMKQLPFFDFTIDEGERNRQRIDRLL